MEKFTCHNCGFSVRTYARSPRCVCGATMFTGTLPDSWAGTLDTFDIVTVRHNARNRALAVELESAIDTYAEFSFIFLPVDNRRNKMSYAAACNSGAKNGVSGIIGFINPDTKVIAPFMQQVVDLFTNNRNIVICGERFDKPQSEVETWGLRDWVCGAAFFVRREWFPGFDERYKWGWEETDLCRQAEAEGYIVRSIPLPLKHSSPVYDTAVDKAFKQSGMEIGNKVFTVKWKDK
jgi:hypothetical protein